MTPLYLGFDTSCYTTSVAILDENGEILADRRKMLEVPMGGRGLRQQEMVFQHTAALPELFAKAMEDAPSGGRIAAVAASVRPREVEGSYMPAFLVGQGMGRGAALAAGAPFHQTDHQSGHIAAALIASGLTQTDHFLAMHLSGGTTELLLVENGKCQAIGGTRDSSFGQLVDRTGVLLGLPFPAGPSLEELAVKGEAAGRLGASVQGLTCSVSGAEAAARRLAESGETPENVAAEIYSFLARTAARLLAEAKVQFDLPETLLAGGVASSALFRRLLAERLVRDRVPLRVHFAQPHLSGDNAVGVACIARRQAMETEEREGLRQPAS